MAISEQYIVQDWNVVQLYFLSRQSSEVDY